MAALDFLFNGTPPASITSESTSVQGMPDWYQDYTKGLVAKANAVAAEPYTPYGGSRIAGLNEKDRQAGSMVQSNVGSYQPYLNQANNAYTSALGMRGADAANPYLERSSNISGLSTGQPLINQGAQGSGLAAANPYLGQASSTWPSSMDQYMSPYTGAVVDEIARKGTQNLMENILPGVNDTFTGGGMFGGSRHAGFTNRAIRDTATGIAGEQAKALEAGYGTSANIFGQDQARLAGLGSTAGGLAGQDYSRMVGAGQALGGLAGQDASNLTNIGNIKGTLTAGDARNAIDVGNQMTNLGQVRSGLGAADAAAISGLGEQERGLTQNMLNSQYQDFLNQRAYPQEQLNWLSGILRGQQAGIPRSATISETGAAPVGTVYGPSLASTLLGVGSKLGGLQGYF